MNYLKKLYSGRIGGLAFLIGGIITFGWSWLSSSLFKSENSFVFIASIAALFLMVVFTFSLYARRLHDLNKTAWWSLLLFVPLANFILIIILILKPGTKGENRYGSPPRGYNSLLQDLFAL